MTADEPLLRRRARARRAWLRERVYILPALALLAVTLPHLEQGDFRTDTGWYSAIALQAWRTGELWTLYGEPGQPYFNKPPLAFWVHGLVLRVLGPSVLAARLPTVLAALGCVLATVAMVRELSGRRAALLSGIVLALSLEFFRRVREISLDMWQLLFMLLALLLVAKAVRRERWGLLAAAGVPLGLAMMCKPLTALAVVPVVGVWMVSAGLARRTLWLLATAAVAVLVAAPWHVSMYLSHGHEFTAQYFGAEIADRAAGKLADPTRGASPPWFYARQIAAGYWPWLGLVGLAAAAWFTRRGRWRDGRGAGLAAVWTLAWLLLLSLYADRRDRYALPVYPGLAWLAGLAAAYWPWRTRRLIVRVLPRWLVAGVVVAGVVVAVLPVRVQRRADPQWPALFEWLRRSGADVAAGVGVWQGSFPGDKGARVYLEFGWWPRTTQNRWGEFVARPPEGALLLYHRRAGRGPGANETVLFEEKDLKVTRLGPGGWSPVISPDAGE